MLQLDTLSLFGSAAVLLCRMGAVCRRRPGSRGSAARVLFDKERSLPDRLWDSAELSPEDAAALARDLFGQGVPT